MGRQPTVSNEELARLYLFEGLSTHGVAQQCGLTQGAVHQRIQKLGIGRTKSESLKLAFKMGHKERTGGRPSKCEGDKYLQGNYLQIYSPNHPYSKPRDGYVAEHRAVWELTHGRQLPKGWVVHHQNGIKTDNRPQNLVAMPTEKHEKFISILKQRIRELEIENSQLRRAIETKQLALSISEN